MEDGCFFNIAPVQPSRNLGNLPWMQPQSQANYVRHQQTIDQISNLNDGQNASGHASSGPNHHGGDDHEVNNIDTWNPMDDDFACPAFNSYKNFDVLNAEHPSEKSPEKSTRQSPEKRAEEISLYVGNIPLSITKEGIKNLFSTVGEVQSCYMLPPKDPSYDTKYGFVKFCTWREATKAIETFDGFYVGCEKNLQVRVAHRRRGGDDYYAIKDEDYSSADGVAQGSAKYNQHPPLNDSYNFDDENQVKTSDQNFNTSQNCPAEVNQMQNEQTLNMSPGVVDSREHTSSENLPTETRHEIPAVSPRAKLPCTYCEKLCTQRCSACKAPYCSRKCQKNDKARHKLACSYQAKTAAKPANPSPPAHAPVAESEPSSEPEYDSIFDCIDISLDTTPFHPRKEIVKDSASEGNIVLDSGYTGQKEDMNEFQRKEKNAGTEMAMSQAEIRHVDKLGGQASLEKEFVGYVTAVSFVNTIWAVVRTPDYPRFCELTAQMAEITEESLEKITAVTMGSLCLARFSLDNCWYRSRILQSNTEQVEVIFVDYGNKEWKNIHDLYQLPPGFTDVPPQARQFFLHGVTPVSHSEIGQRMVEFLEGMVAGKTFVFETVNSAPDCIPEVIVRDQDAKESINEQMKIYLGQETSHVRSIPDQSNVGMTASGSISPNYSGANSTTNNQTTSYVSGHEPSIHKIYMASEVPDDILPSTKQFGIFVCHFESPNSFWIWFLDTAKERLQKLSLMLSETYDQSTYSEYLPIVGELIVAKFTDGVWYRAKVDYVSNDCTLKVTFIDFGNSEDVSLYDTRRISEPLVVIPKLATKCAVHGMEQKRNWSEGCDLFCSELMLNKRGSAIVQHRMQDSLVLRVDVVINGEMKSVVDEVVKQGYFISEMLQTQDSGVLLGNTPPEQTSLNKDCASLYRQPPTSFVPSETEPVLPVKKQVFPSNQPVVPSSKPVIPPTQPVMPSSQPVIPSTQPVIPPTQPVTPSTQPVIPSNQPVIPSTQPVIRSTQPVIPSTQPVIRSTQPVIPSTQPVLPSTQHVLHSSQPGIPSSQTNFGVSVGQKVKPTYKTMLPLPTVPSEAFNVIVNDVLSADNFYVQMIDPNLVSQLQKCVRELNEHVTKNHPPKVENAAVGRLGCARFSQDNVWYRAQVLKIDDGNYKVRFVDFGNIEDVRPDEFLEVPEFFYQLAPQAICCRLGTNVRLWGEHSRRQMEKLTLHKQFLCTVIGGTSWPQFSVKLQSAVGDKIIDIAEEMSKIMESCRPMPAPAHSPNTPSPPTTRAPSPCPVKSPSPYRASTPSPQSSSVRRHSTTFADKVLRPAIFASDIAEVGRKYEVHVSSVSHPTYFWIQDAKNVENLKLLQKELNSHYNNSSFPPSKPLLHSFCVYIYRDTCYRVFVRKFTAKGFLVHCVDFGREMLADEKFFRPLDAKFCSQPFGAMLCSLHSVRPFDDKLWAAVASRYFRKKVYSRKVTIYVRYNSKSRLFVDMFDPDSSEECLVNRALVAQGFAKEFKPTLGTAEAPF